LSQLPLNSLHILSYDLLKNLSIRIISV